jgi:hypothetical protein
MAREKKSMVLAIVAVIVAVILLAFVFVKPVLSDNHRVLLVASDVLAQAGGQAKFESYLIKGISVVPYNYDRVATYAELGDLIKAHIDSNGASRVRSVGIVYHTPNRYNLQCFASDPAKSTVSGSPESFESFRRFVVALRAAYGVDDVDLVSCDVVSAERNVLTSLDFNGARVNASTNVTGQVKQGPVGDWVLEAGNVNLIGRYFNATITNVDLALVYSNEFGQPVSYLTGNALDHGFLMMFIDNNPRLTSDQIVRNDQLFKNYDYAKTQNGYMVEKKHIDHYREWRRRKPVGVAPYSYYTGYNITGGGGTPGFIGTRIAKYSTRG